MVRSWNQLISWSSFGHRALSWLNRSYHLKEQVSWRCFLPLGWLPYHQNRRSIFVLKLGMNLQWSCSSRTKQERIYHTHLSPWCFLRKEQSIPFHCLGMGTCFLISIRFWFRMSWKQMGRVFRISFFLLSSQVSILWV